MTPFARTLPCAITTALLFCASIAHAGPFQWTDSFVGYRYGQDYREPGDSEKITKNIFQIQHADGYAYGSNFLNLDMLQSCGGSDPARDSTHGATEFYFVFRSTLSAAKVMQNPVPIAGIIRDVGLTAGCDLGTKNDPFASRKRALNIGPTITFNTPGFVNLSLMWNKENNHNGIIEKNIYFNPTWCVEVTWGIPIAKTPFVFKGFADFVGKKGKDGFGNETAPETLIEAAIMIDPFYNRPALKGKFYVGVGYQFWNNKFGNDVALDPSGGSRASCAQLQLEAHF